jgi:predicted enzyme related to lactoylglutathione lyase
LSGKAFPAKVGAVLAPYGVLLYRYVGVADLAGDLAFYTEALGAELVWRFEAFGAEVAAVRLGPGPLVLLADHRPAPSVLPIWSVDDLDRAFNRLEESGWAVTAGRVEVPDGPCLVLTDPSGNEIALLHQVRPQAMGDAFADVGNAQAVRQPSP